MDRSDYAVLWLAFDQEQISQEARNSTMLADAQRSWQEAHVKELGYEHTIDPDFNADLEEIIKCRKPRNISAPE